MVFDSIDPIYLMAGLRVTPAVFSGIIGTYLGMLNGAKYDKNMGFRRDVLDLTMEGQQEAAAAEIDKSESISKKASPFFSGGVCGLVASCAGAPFLDFAAIAAVSAVGGWVGFDIGKDRHERKRKRKEFNPTERSNLERLYDLAVAAFVTRDKNVIIQRRLHALNYQFGLLGEKSGTKTLEFVTEQAERLNAYETP